MNPSADLQRKIDRLTYLAEMIEMQDRMSGADHQRLRDLKQEIADLRAQQRAAKK